MEELREVLTDVARLAPGSQRELARKAGISHTALRRATEGRFVLSAAKLEALALALENWGETCRDLAARIREVAADTYEEGKEKHGQ